MRTLSIINFLFFAVMPAQMAGQALSFFRPTPGFGPTAVAVNASGIYVAGSSVAKYDSNGNQQWTTGGNGPGSGVAADTTGVYTAVGATLRKYGNGGNQLWSRTLQSEYTTAAVARDTSGVYAAVRDGFRHFLGKYSVDGSECGVRAVPGGGTPVTGRAQRPTTPCFGSKPIHCSAPGRWRSSGTRAVHSRSQSHCCRSRRSGYFDPPALLSNRTTRIEFKG
jgi:hypothetical protein